MLIGACPLGIPSACVRPSGLAHRIYQMKMANWSKHSERKAAQEKASGKRMKDSAYVSSSSVRPPLPPLDVCVCVVSHGYSRMPGLYLRGLGGEQEEDGEKYSEDSDME